ncbi:MAG: PAS domain-containing protein [Rubrivivax sp.]|nr:PAS domain-containing protein [Rubrivivax sp.]
MSFVQRLLHAPPAVSRLTLVGRAGTTWLLSLTSLAVLAISVLESSNGLLRPLDRWLYPILVGISALSAFAVQHGSMPHALGLRLVSLLGSLYLGIGVSVDLLTGRVPTLYDMATLMPWLLIAHVMLFATYRAPVALVMSGALSLSLLPLLLWPGLPPATADILGVLAANGMVAQGLMTGMLYAVSLQFAHLAMADAALHPRDEPITVRELMLRRRQERRRLEALAERADAAAREQERELLSMLRAFPGYVMRVDPDGRISQINARLAAAYGRKPAELIGLHLEEVVGLEGWKQARLRQTTVRVGGQPIVFELSLSSPSGHELRLLFTQYAVSDENGQPSMAFYQVGLDVTEHRQTQRALEQTLAQLDALFEALPLPTGMKDVEGRYVRVNRALCELMRLKPSEILGRTAREFVSAENVKAHEGTDRAAIETRQVQSYAVAHRPADIDRVDMMVHKAAVFTASGEHAGMVTTIVDLTEINRAARLMQQAREAAESANAAKSAFLATMSHEIRTPMNGVIGMAEILLHSPLSPDQAKSVHTVRDSAQGLLALLDGILDFSKIEAGKLELDCAPLEPRALVQSTAAMMEAHARARGVHLLWHVQDRVPQRLLGDEMRLRQVLNNLVSNAVKFSGGQPHRDGRVSVALTMAEASLSLEVGDNGIGMDEATQSRIFEPFVQAEASTTRRFGGSGLGLAITRRLVDLMGGRIELRSEPEVGSTFRILLPLRAQGDLLAVGRGAAAAAGVQDAPATPPQAGAPWLTRSSGPAAAEARAADVASAPSPPPAISILKRTARPGIILVAEDEPVNRMVLLRQLELLGHQTEVAVDGAQALQMWQLNRYDLLLTDLHMPMMDGYALAREIRAREAAGSAADQRMPILALTANALQGEEGRALAAGVDEYLTKPIRMQELQQVLARWLVVEPGSGRADGAAAPDQHRDSALPL